MKAFSLLLLAALAFTAVAADSQWIPGNDGDLLADLKIDVNEIAREAAVSFPSVPRTSELSGRWNPAGCWACQHIVGSHILEMVLMKVKRACENTKCPVIKARCEWIAKHEDEFTGYVVYRVKPLKDAYFFCFGAGQCPHPAAAEAEQMAVQFNSTAEADLLAQLAHTEGMLERALVGNATVDESSDAAVWSSSAPTPSGDDKECHECLGKGVRFVLKRAIRKVIKACEETKCPYFRAWCDWAKNHKKFVRGEIYAKVEPYKYAIGYCAGNGACKCGNDTASFPFTMKGFKHESKFNLLHD